MRQLSILIAPNVLLPAAMVARFAALMTGIRRVEWPTAAVCVMNREEAHAQPRHEPSRAFFGR